MRSSMTFAGEDGSDAGGTAARVANAKEIPETKHTPSSTRRNNRKAILSAHYSRRIPENREPFLTKAVAPLVRQARRSEPGQFKLALAKRGPESPPEPHDLPRRGLIGHRFPRLNGIAGRYS